MLCHLYTGLFGVVDLFCVHVCMYLYVWGVHMFTHVLGHVSVGAIVFVCTCVWRPEVDMGHLPWSLSSLYTEVSSLGPGAHVISNLLPCLCTLGI